MNEKRRLLGMTLDELKGVAFEAGLPGYAAKQMADWLYKKKVTSIAAMTNIRLRRNVPCWRKTLRWGPYLLPT